MNLERLKSEKMHKNRRKQVVRRQLRLLSLIVALTSTLLLLGIGGRLIFTNVDWSTVFLPAVESVRGKEETGSLETLNILGVNLDTESGSVRSKFEYQKSSFVTAIVQDEQKQYIYRLLETPVALNKPPSLPESTTFYQLSDVGALQTLREVDSTQPVTTIYNSPSSDEILTVKPTEIALNDEVVWEIRNGGSLLDLLFVNGEVFLLVEGENGVFLQLVQNWQKAFDLYHFRSVKAGSIKFLQSSEQDFNANEIGFKINEQCYVLNLIDRDEPVKKDCPSDSNKSNALNYQNSVDGQVVEIAYQGESTYLSGLVVEGTVIHRDMLFVAGRDVQTKLIEVYFLPASVYAEDAEWRQLPLPEGVQKGQLATSNTGLYLISNTVIGDKLYRLDWLAEAADTIPDADEEPAASAFTSWQEITPEPCKMEVCTLQLVL